MQTFHCTHCQNLVFFENVRCLKCERALAYIANRRIMAALQQGTDGFWRCELDGETAQPYKLCANYSEQNICNWAVPADDPKALCFSCRLTRVIPELTQAGNKEAWYRLEVAKRRMLYTLVTLQLPLEAKIGSETPGLAFEFLKDSIKPNGDKNRVFTGHDNGLITINLAEADDVQREKQRLQQNEPYRTLLGHFRHEIGHYYWDRLIQGSSRLENFRQVFGDERASYEDALKHHYEYGPPQNWEREYISAYANMHPWEDWAESWAHFLHMTDALETAGATGFSLNPNRQDEPSVAFRPESNSPNRRHFDHMIDQWGALTYAINNFSRGLGLPDNYPFVLSPRVIEKLRFIWEATRDVANGVQVQVQSFSTAQGTNSL